MLDNQLRLSLASVAYVLVNELRRTGLRGPELESAQAGTIRVRFLKIAARITLSVRRVVVSLASVHPLQAVFAQALATIQRRYHPLICRAGSLLRARRPPRCGEMSRAG